MTAVVDAVVDVPAPPTVRSAAERVLRWFVAAPATAPESRWLPPATVERADTASPPARPMSTRRRLRPRQAPADTATSPDRGEAGGDPPQATDGGGRADRNTDAPRSDAAGPQGSAEAPPAHGANSLPAAFAHVAPEARSAPGGSAMRLAVLGASPHAAAVAAAVAGEVRAPSAVVCAWSGTPSDHPTSALGTSGGAVAQPREDAADTLAMPAAPGTRAAQRAVASLRDAGIAATARGRLAWVALPADPEEAAAMCDDVVAFSTMPVVVAIGGPRPEALDAIVESQDAVVLVVDPRDALLAEVARAAVEGPRRSVHVVPPPSAVERLVALAGLGRMPGLRDALTPQPVTA